MVLIAFVFARNTWYMILFSNNIIWYNSLRISISHLYMIDYYALTVTITNFNFGNRKIQKVRYSYHVPLPVQWVKTMKIEKGNCIKIEMQDDYSLRITPVPQARQDSEGTGSATPTNLKKRCSHGNYDIKR